MSGNDLTTSARLRAMAAFSPSLEVEAAQRLVEETRFTLAWSTARLEAMRARLRRIAGIARRGRAEPES